MKTASLRTLSLTLVFTAGEFLVDRPTLINLAGAAPGLGAIELGQTAPHYGPRD
jgi:hypothetical protein